MKPSRAIALVALGLLIGLPVGWYSRVGHLKYHRQQTIENYRQLMIASRIYALAYSNNPAAVTELLLTNQSVTKP